MNECLVTKLKSSVNDNELYRIGELRGNITVDKPDAQFVVKGLNPNIEKDYVVTVEANFQDGTTKRDIFVSILERIGAKPAFSQSEPRLLSVKCRSSLL